MPARTRALTLALSVSTLLAACNGRDAPPTTSAPSVAASSSRSSISAPPDPAQTASPSPAEQQRVELVLGGTNLGVTMLGAPFPEAVEAITSVLGAPIENPADEVFCLASTKAVQWEGFRLAEGNGGVAAGWVASTLTLQTPSGVRVGTDLATLERVYGADLRVFPPNTDSSRRTFEVQGADVLGDLDADDTVRTLYSSFCSGP